MLMHYMQRLFQKFRKEEEGAGLAEYALLLALIAVVCIGAIGTLSGGIQAIFEYIGGALSTAAGG